MAVTETSAPTDVGNVGSESTAAPGKVGGLAGLLGTGDHKTLGRTWIALSLLLGVVTLGLLAVSAVGQPSGSEFPPPGEAFRISTLGRVSVVFLFIVPLFIGLATFVTPLQVGARTVAFPRAAAAALWTWLVSSIVMVASWFAGGGFGADDNELVDLSVLALFFVIVSILLALVCICTTVIALRTPGMYLDRVPFFSWSMLVAGGVWIAQLAVVLADLALVYVDHHFANARFFGEPTAQWASITWFFTQPAVFALAIPALGIASDIVAGLSAGRQRRRGLVLAGIGLFGALSFGAWAQPFVEDLPGNPLFMGVSFAIVLPLLMVLIGWFSTFAKGRPKLASPLAAGVLGGVLLLAAAVCGALYVIEPLDLFAEPSSSVIEAIQEDQGSLTVWQMGLNGLVLGAAALGGLAGVTYWRAKITGRSVGDGPNKLAVLLVLAGGLVYGVPYLIMGLSSYDDALSFATAAGAGLAAVGVALVGASLLTGRSHQSAPDDPWGSGKTLEWATSSPPAPGNFGELAPVTSAEPLLDDTEGGEA